MNIRNYLRDWKKKIDEELEKYLPGENIYPGILSRSMRYTVLGGGKRIRPILIISSYRVSGGEDTRSIMPVCAAVEFIHSYSLIHDDLPAMDNDNFRRGLPTSHRKFGEDIAILAGDALFSHAFRMIGIAPIDSDVKIEVMKVLTKAIGNEGIIGGQVMDVKSDVNTEDPKVLRYIHSHKTAFFLSACCEIGVALAGGDEEKRRLARRGGLFLGMAYQIIDDILDVEGNMEKIGKETGNDEGKLTYPGYYGVDFSRKIAGRYTQKSKNLFSILDGKKEIMESIVSFLLERER